MLTKDLGSIREASLKCFTQNWIERLILTCADIETAQ